MAGLSDAEKRVTKMVLKEARALVAAGWCRGAFVRDKHRHVLNDIWSERACKFCASAALRRVGSTLKYPKYLDNQADFILQAAMGTVAIPNFNDSHTKKQVLEKFDEAIASL